MQTAARDRPDLAASVPAVHIPALPQRERQVLELVQASETSVEIARRLGLSPRSVDSVVHRARLRLGATTRLQAAILAADHHPGSLSAPPEGDRSVWRDDHVVDEIHDLIRALREGATVTAAARAAGMSRRTASRRLAELRDRLGATSTAQTVALACRRLTPDDYPMAS